MVTETDAEAKEDGVGYKVSLLAAKARIKSEENVLTPRREMDSLAVLCRMMTAVLPGLVQLPTMVVIVGDSKRTIAAEESKDTTVHLFLANYVSEVEEHIRGFRQAGVKVGPLVHTFGDQSVADLIMRGQTSIENVAPGSEWQDGPTYLKLL